MSHTPAPWVATQDGSQCVRIDAPNGDPTLEHQTWKRIALVYGSEDDPVKGNQVAWANARLIAAAPELLAALKSCEAVMTETPGEAFETVRELTDHELGKLWIAVIKEARAAIRRAEGQ